jgi:uncharacterized lipoprotein
MKKILSVLVMAFLLNGCRYINTKEPYVNAKESPELKIPEGVDEPNTTSTLAVPEAASQSTSEPIDSTPPDMPIRTKQTEDGNLRIENKEGYPVLTVNAEKDQVLKKMQSIALENWSVSNSNEEDCEVSLTYVDEDAEERKNQGFIKKIFTREEYYSDYSGIYNLNCVEKGSVVEVKFSKQDGTTAKSFLADSVMNKLFDDLKK